MSACTIAAPGPSPVEGAPHFTSVVVGTFHACALSAEGAAYCWGEGSNGQLGNGGTELSSTPVAVLGGYRFAQLAARSDHTCGVTLDGAAYCWGGNPTFGVTRGLKALEQSARSTPVRVAEGVHAQAVAVGDRHVCVLSDSGTAYCWGSDGDGALGTGTSGDSGALVPVAGQHVFRALAAGADHTCALDTNGAAFCWGRGADGQLGQGQAGSSRVPVAGAGGFIFKSIAAGGRYACGLTTDGVAYCWGWNFNQQLGQPSAERCGGSYPCSTAPQAVQANARFVTLALGDERACAIAVGGIVYCWGDNRPVPDRSADVTHRGFPSPLMPERRFTALASESLWRVCGIETTGATLCWPARMGLPPLGNQRLPIPWKMILWIAVGALAGGLLGWLATLLPGREPSWWRIVGGAFWGGVLGFALWIMQALSDLFMNMG